ncbi:MAG TPA: thioredoxin domain-containing protein [Planctomycetota bacterium]|nr:thioredoxin domain-containing protein [Planctomycetota bacterium]
MPLPTALLLACLPTLPMTDPQQSHGDRPPLPTPAEIAALPPDGGPEFNRLVFEGSPYLLQHARNPVDWYPWGDEAFARAQAEDRPIFLSIGYATCHWCHVMEHESFEDAEVAALLNAAFVCVKVDREERPDVDQLYMSVTQAMTGSGGWPMTVVLTPERVPFFAGTYFPKGGAPGRPGMLELVPGLAKAWADERENVTATAARVREWLAKSGAGGAAGELDAAWVARTAQALMAGYDRRHGGFGEAPKFPTPHNLRLLLRHARTSGDAQAVEQVVATLRAMRRGGIWDHVGFGFHRYSTDAQWLLPHFEKMLYDQALIALACIEAWQVTGHDDLRRTAEEIFAYVARDLTDAQGGFRSAEDADSEGEEGLFYLWRPEELSAALGETDGKLAALLWGVVAGGNFRDQATGERTDESILHLAVDVAQFARARELEPESFAARVESWRTTLLELRATRPRPLCDDKVLTDWNGLMIAALAFGGRALGEPRHVAAAERAADFVLAHLRRDDGRLLKRWRAGRADHDGVHDDNAFLAWGLVELYEAGGDPVHLRTALELERTLHARFHDDEHGGYFLAGDDADDLIVRAKESYDGALPAGNSVAAMVQLRLARLTGSNELEARGRATLAAFAGDVARQGLGHAEYLCALDFALRPGFELVLCGPQGDAGLARARRELGRRFLPGLVLLERPDPDHDGRAAALAELAPFTAAQRALEGRATYYLCRAQSCEAPTGDLARVLAELDAARTP